MANGKYLWIVLALVPPLTASGALADNIHDTNGSLINGALGSGPGSVHAVLYRSVPEPAFLTVFVGGLVGVVPRRRHR